MSKTNDANETYINSGSLKNLFDGCEIAKRPVLIQALLDLYDIDYAKPPNHYPFQRYLEIVEWLRQQLYPYYPKNKGYEQIGRNISKAFFHTSLGKVLKPTLTIAGTQRAITYFFRIVGGALPFGEFKIIEQRPGYIKAILYKVPGPPDLTRGMGLECMDTLDVKDGTITYTKLTLNDTQFEARWPI